MNNDQQIRSAAIGAASLYVAAIGGAPEDIVAVADVLARYITSGLPAAPVDVKPQAQTQKLQETLRDLKKEAKKAVSTPPVFGQPQGQPDEATAQQYADTQGRALSLASQGHDATSRSQITRLAEEASKGGLEQVPLKVEGARVPLVEYLRNRYRELPAEDVPQVIDPTRTDPPVRNNTLRSELGL